MRLGEGEAERIALGGEPVDHRAAGIAEPQHLGTLVECLPHRIIDRLADNFIFQRRRDLHDLRIAPAHQQAQIRK